MSLFLIECVNSLYDHFKADADFEPTVYLGFDGKIERKAHIRVAWGDGDLIEGTGEFESSQVVYVEGWVFDPAPHVDRRGAYDDLAILLRDVIKHVYTWRDAHSELSVAVSVQNHGDAFAPMYGFQLTVSVSSNHICRIIDNL